MSADALAPYVRILGRGPGRARSLTQAEATQAMALILRGEGAPQAVGALLMLLRMRGETPDEIAGFADALRDTLPPLPPAGLDWPSYAAGRTRGLPWFLLSARLVARAGVRVLIHGWNSHQGAGADVRAALPHAGIARAASVADAARLMERDAIAYLPLEAFSPAALDLLRLRQVLGLRSCVNTVLRVLNPSRAPATVQGVFHPPYRGLQQGACALLGQPRATIIKGGGGEFERPLTKAVTLFLLIDGVADEWIAPALTDTDDDPHTDPAALAALWSGTLTDPLATARVTGTAALALMATGQAADHDAARAIAETLWRNR